MNRRRMKKDIVFLCQFFYPEYNSSATLPFDTAKSLAESGYSVGALCGYPKEYSNISRVPSKENKDGVSIRRLRYLQVKRGKKAGRLVNYFSFTTEILMHIACLRKYRAIIVYSNPPILPVAALLAKRIFGCKVVFVSYDVYPEVAYASKSLRPDSIISSVMGKINDVLYRNADSVIALTDEMRGFLLKNRPQLKAERIHTIPNWAHEEASQKTEGAAEYFGYHEDEFIVSYFGNIGICQEMDTLIAAIQKLRAHSKIRFFIAGHGCKRGLLTERLKDCPNVQIVDFLHDDAYSKALSISSCFVVTLEQGLTGTCAPSKYYSYLQEGKAIISVTEKESYLFQEINARDIGIPVQIGESDKLVNAILSMYENSERTAQMGKNAKDLYRCHYAKEISLAKYGSLFEELLTEEKHHKKNREKSMDPTE